MIRNNNSDGSRYFDFSSIIAPREKGIRTECLISKDGRPIQVGGILPLPYGCIIYFKKESGYPYGRGGYPVTISNGKRMRVKVESEDPLIRDKFRITFENYINKPFR
ncbi:hypothetical protein BMS3Abin17_00580 [archaeon BMS3Abin17]|nr:hypothetical protein BMS3Abin17_00580 [archaeon BMS3Abin17]HDZ60611.1 hypothetical protein [Candidatus Pacearchaeota archaeon]